MNDDPVYTRLREAGWRRKLTPAEEAELRAYLAAHPEARPDWETETALGEILMRLPEAPVPSNFAARVLQCVEREVAGRERPWRRGWSWPALAPRVALAAAVAGLGLVAYQQYEVAQRTALARNLVAVLDVESLPSPEVLADFDAIRRLNKAPAADEELLALLR